ncbi:hypothetical protein MML48_9g00003666 [Holotrichia oblita]|uniref:Uncharacterized protein n=1 Tax=Holotrichia oblita TaxID=644536 RepID=A0ACB9SN59_HOLOL|nr:hypothetical protein MML48_9g00003666 [Holotrichia oblita]
MDETGFCSDPSRVKVVGEKGVNSTRITAGTGRSNTSVLFSAAADGSKAPPLIIFKRKNVWDSWIPEEGMDYPGTTYAASTNGWMESKIFKNYFVKTFIPQLTEQRPILLLCDGHASHVDLEVIDAAIEANITIIQLPLHYSHLLQPLDLTVFRSVRLKWDELLVKWQSENVGKIRNKSKLAEFVGVVWNRIDKGVIQPGFEKGGIYIYCSSAVPRDKFDPQALQRFEKKIRMGST